jgi:hypothetical protein
VLGIEATTFGKYQLCERLAEGGMAVVWRAKIVGPGGFEKEFCLKQIREELAKKPQFIDLFVAEAKLTVSLTHANIVPVYELGMFEGTYFLALELIDGPPISKLVKLGPLPPQLAAYIVEQVLRGLDYAHRRGVVHRDLSAANVLVSRDGEVKIVDFGIAGQEDAHAVQGGSRGYMAPEQEKGGRSDARSDLYAVGVLLWELLSGRRYDGGSLADGTDHQLRAVVLRATAPDPAERHPDAAAMLTQVSRFLRDLSIGPTQAELSTFVRKGFPDVPARRPQGASDPTRATGPRTVPVAGRGGFDPTRATGPRTVPVERPVKQVTFATRIETLVAPAPVRAGRLALLAAGLTVGVTGVGLVGWRLGVHPDAGPSAPISSLPSPKPAPTSAIPTPPTAAQGHLVVRTTPSGVEVRLGDKLLGLTPLERDLALDGPEASSLALHLRKRGLQPVDRTLDPAAFTGTPRTALINERLTPIAQGALTLNALPWAHVTIDGEKRPDTPLKRLSLPAGPHSVRLQCPPTGRELKFTVVVEPDGEVKRLADLRGEPKLLE